MPHALALLASRDRGLPTDRARRRALIEHLYAIVRKVLRHASVPRDIREDLVQEVMLQVLKSWDRYDEERGSVSRWLAGIARYQVFDFFKTEKRNPLYLVDSLPDVQSENGDPEGRIIFRDLLETLAAFLSDDERRAVILREIEGCSYEEIGEIEGISSSTAWTRYERGAAKFRQAAARDNARACFFLGLFITGGDEPPPDVLARASRHVMDALDSGALPESEPPASGVHRVDPDRRLGASPSRAPTRAGATGALVVLALAMGALLVPSHDTAPTAIVAVAEPVASPAPATPPEAPPPAPPAVPSARLLPPRSSGLRSPVGPDTGVELDLVRKAARALDRGNTTAALLFVEKHARAFPKGLYVQDRDGLRLEALIRDGRFDEARARLDAFARSYPKNARLGAFRKVLAAPPQ